MVRGIDSLKFNPNPYGSIKRTDFSENGRIFYNIINSKGGSAGRLSVPEKDADTFEAAYNDIMTTAPEIENYVAANSSPYDIKRRKRLSIATVAGSGFIGGIASALTTIGVKSGAKRILSIIAGTFAGLAIGFGASLLLTTPPGSFKFAKATRTLNSLDIQTIND